MRKKLIKERQELTIGRLSFAADGEFVKRKLLQLDFELQKLDQEEV